VVIVLPVEPALNVTEDVPALKPLGPALLVQLPPTEITELLAEIVPPEIVRLPPMDRELVRESVPAPAKVSP